jgi:chromosome segregation ATPase
MARETLLQMLERLSVKIKALEGEKGKFDAALHEVEREKRQAAATIEALERAWKQAAVTIETLERGEKQTANRVQELEQENRQARVIIQGLERQVGELGALICQASEKVDEMLNDGDTVIPAAASTAAEPPEESPVQAQKDLDWRSGKAFRFD